MIFRKKRIEKKWKWEGNKKEGNKKRGFFLKKERGKKVLCSVFKLFRIKG